MADAREPEGAETDQQHDTVLVVDLGAQYAQLIARRVREAHVHSEIVPAHHQRGPSWSREGRAQSSSRAGRSRSTQRTHTASTRPYSRSAYPCWGSVTATSSSPASWVATVAPTGGGEYGKTDLAVTAKSVLFEDLPESLDVWMSHGDAVTRPPAGFVSTATSAGSPVAAMEDRERRLIGVQFHPEVAHTPRGSEILRAFLYDIAGARPTGRRTRSSSNRWRRCVGWWATRR